MLVNLGMMTVAELEADVGIARPQGVVQPAGHEAAIYNTLVFIHSLCTGAFLYVPYSVLLISNKFCA